MNTPNTVAAVSVFAAQGHTVRCDKCNRLLHGQRHFNDVAQVSYVTCDKCTDPTLHAVLVHAVNTGNDDLIDQVNQAYAGNRGAIFACYEMAKTLG
jgi:hypothetical protein